MLNSFCPHCGTARTEDTAFCGHCGRPLNNELGQPPTAAEPRKSRLGRAEIIVLALIGAAVIGGAQLLTRGALSVGPAGESAPDVPPVGIIWFGSSFDTSTFELRGRTVAVWTGDPISMVAHLPRTMKGSELSIRTSFGGQVVATNAANATGEGDLWGFTLGGLSSGGQWRYELIDFGGNMLASGTISVTER